MKSIKKLMHKTVNWGSFSSDRYILEENMSTDFLITKTDIFAHLTQTKEKKIEYNRNTFPTIIPLYAPI